MSTQKFFTDIQQQAIIKSIEKAELNTSGEIRLHVEDTCKINPVERAIEIFEKLEMHKTELRNGVLFYLATKDKKIAVIGDKGINDIVTENFWDDVKNEIINQFKNNQFTEGICKGIEKAGEKLKMHFPFQTDDTNELSNDISFGE
jgi:uncharacterized membrane protein